MTNVGVNVIKAGNLLYNESKDIKVSICEIFSTPVALEESGHELGGG